MLSKSGAKTELLLPILIIKKKYNTLILVIIITRIFPSYHPTWGQRGQQRATSTATAAEPPEKAGAGAAGVMIGQVTQVIRIHAKAPRKAAADA